MPHLNIATMSIPTQLSISYYNKTIKKLPSNYHAHQTPSPTHSPSSNKMTPLCSLYQTRRPKIPNLYQRLKNLYIGTNGSLPCMTSLNPLRQKKPMNWLTPSHLAAKPSSANGSSTLNTTKIIPLPGSKHALSQKVSLKSQGKISHTPLPPSRVGTPSVLFSPSLP